ncbi:MAG: hypothetical protein JST06_01435 [Bacteroidetes bacterium]|nr:hypothetical protein [Bacteroidota bacterium]MBS1630586.1 hypothetical protein [Bacteroidota bacterium]
MKRIFSLALCILCFTQIARAQGGQQLVGCMDPAIRLQAETIKQHYVKQGFKVYRDAMINMESMVPFPIMVQLAKGHLYEIIFVGNPRATNHRMMVYDSDDRKFDEKSVSKHHGDDASNYIIYEFSPERTDAYVFEFMTRLKNENFCGSVCILAADATKGEVKYTPYTP